MTFTRIFTFGADHVSPFTGERLGNKYVTVITPEGEKRRRPWDDDLDRARKMIMAVFGTAWAFDYPTPEKAGVERFGLIEHARIELTLSADHGADRESSDTPKLVTPPRQALELRYLCHAILGIRGTECGMPIEYVFTRNAFVSGWYHVDRTVDVSHPACAFREG